MTIRYEYMLVKQGFRLNILGTDEYGRRVGLFLEAPVPYQSLDGFQRDYAVKVVAAKEAIEKALAAMPQIKVA
jgi:hypothetical protein